MLKRATILCVFLGLVSLAMPRLEARPGGAGFSLLAFQLATSKEKMVVNGVQLRRTIRRADSVAFAWVDIGRYQVKALDKKLEKGEVIFSLLAPSGAAYPVEGNIVYDIKETNVVCLNFLPGSGGDFVAPLLIATIDDQRVAEWRLTDYPTDERLIPADEPSVTRIDSILGLSVEATATSRIHEKFLSRETGFVNLELDVGGAFDPKLEYWVSHEVTESTWRRELSWGGHGDLFEKPRKTGLGRGTEFAAYADRVRLVGSVEVRQCYEEPVVFRGLEVVWDARTRQFHIVNRRAQEFVLSTGLKVVMPVFDDVVTLHPESGNVLVGVEVMFPDGTKDLFLPKAQDALRSIQGVSVVVGKVVANEDWTDPGGYFSAKHWGLRMLAAPKSLKAGTVFDVSMGFKHQVTISKEEFRLLVPLQRLKASWAVNLGRRSPIRPRSASRPRRARA